MGSYWFHPWLVVTSVGALNTGIAAAFGDEPLMWAMIAWTAAAQMIFLGPVLKRRLLPGDDDGGQ